MTNTPPSMSYGAAQPTPPPPSPTEPTRSSRRAPWLVAIALLAAAAIALGVVAVMASSAASDAQSERDELREDLLDVDAALETTQDELGTSAQSLTETQDALAVAEDAVDDLQDDKDDLEDDLTEARDAVVDGANPFATQEQLDEFRRSLSDSRTLLTTAESVDELNPFFFTFDSDFNELVALNVTADLSECKTVLANNGFATTILVASSIASLLEFEPELVEEAQAEIAASDSIAESIFDQACGPLPEG